jgi:uncharacterized protein
MAQWDKIESSGNVEDRRGNKFSPAVGVGSLGAVVLLGIMLFSGGGSSADIQSLLEQLSGTGSNTTSQGDFIDTKNYKSFAEKIVGSNNEVWKTELKKSNITYDEPTLVLFRNATNSACGGASSDIGPHYCPNDKTIYLDETFFDELTTRFGAKGGEVAEAYVIAHEIGHHIQQENGTFGAVNTRDNETSILVELQADCFAGVWAGTVSAQGIITQAEVSQAIDAAEAVGDDRIQKKTTGYTNPETWTHGSSVQRKAAFLEGYKAKTYKSCELK